MTPKQAKRERAVKTGQGITMSLVISLGLTLQAFAHHKGFSTK